MWVFSESTDNLKQSNDGENESMSDDKNICVTDQKIPRNLKEKNWKL